MEYSDEDITENTEELETPKSIKEMMNIEYTYPSPDDEKFQEKIYEKREFYYHKIPQRKKVTNYEEVKEQRDAICSRKFALHEHQSFISNYINPNTPYKGVLLFHGTGKSLPGLAPYEQSGHFLYRILMLEFLKSVWGGA